jgi:putative uncharacterized protein PY07530
MANGLEGVLGGFAGILGGAMGVPVNLAINKIVELKKNKKSNPKEVTLENIFDTLKEKISKYSESVEINTLEVAKIEEEIRSLKAKIDELNSSTEGKSKIEKMKIILNITSIESEITLKEVDLEEKKKAKANYEEKVESSNKNLDPFKNNLITYIQTSEEDIEMNIKKSNVSNKQAIIIDGIELTRENIAKLKKLGLENPLDLINYNLTSNDLEDLIRLCTNELYDISIKSFKDGIKKREIVLEGNELFVGILEACALYNLRKLEPLFYKNIPKIILGKDLEETKNYYDNIMKVELSNLENIEKEKIELDEQIKLIQEYNEDILYLEEETEEELKKIVLEEKEKLQTLEREKEKLKIKKEAIQNKINTVNEMVDEMIKEVIKEELKKREIVIPSFVPVTKYFNAPSEEE